MGTSLMLNDQIWLNGLSDLKMAKWS